jgi:GNAT superfamily N-acetyltransferase
MGIAFVREFYRFAARSSEEIVLWKDRDGEVIGGCVASLSPGTLSRRLLFRTTLIIRLARAPLRLLLALATPSTTPLRAVVGMPELILLFTHAGKRSLGVGAQLVRECEDVLSRLGVQEYYVKTLDAQDNRAIGFYLREGFEERGSALVHNEQFRFLTKKIRPGAANETAPSFSRALNRTAAG